MLKNNKLSLAIFLVIVIVLGIYVYKHAPEFAVINRVEPLSLLPLFILSLLLLTFNGLLTRLFVGLFGIELTPQEWFGLAVITAMGNYLAPFKGGIAGKALYLKKKHQFPYTTFLATYSACYLLMFLVGSLLGLVALIIFYLLYQLVDWRLFSFFLIVGLVVWGALRFSDYVPKGAGRISQRWRNLIQGWQYIKKDRAFLIKVALVIFLNYIVIGVQLYYGYWVISQEIPYLAAWFMAIILSFSIFVSLTPGNLGVQETIIALLSKLFGLGFNEGLLVAALLRVVAVSITFSLGPIFSYKLTKSL